MDTQPSRLTIEPGSDRTLRAVGVVDSHTADSLADKLRTLGTTADIDLDLSGVEFIDSSGLRVLVSAHQDLQGAAHELRLAGLSQAVNRLFEITGLHDHLTII